MLGLRLVLVTLPGRFTVSIEQRELESVTLNTVFSVVLFEFVPHNQSI